MAQERTTTEKTTTIDVRGVELTVRHSGKGRSFIWGHGLLTSMAQEDDVGLFDFTHTLKGTRLIRYDARGHGSSKATYDPDAYRWSELAEDMLGVADALGIGKTILGGLSMGCGTSLHAATAHPKRVEALVLVAPPTAWRSRPRQARIYRFGAGIVRWTGLGAFRLLSALPSPASQDSVVAKMQSALVSHLARSDDRAVVAALLGAAESDLPAVDSLRKLKVPVLILAWRYDPVHPVATAEKLARVLPDAELHIAEGLDDIREWPELIRDFLGRSM